MNPFELKDYTLFLDGKGEAYVSYSYIPVPPLKNITIRSNITDDSLVDFTEMTDA